ncbi:YgfZ/GcvT domain-containing protein [Salinibacterium hongtaonis]|uniref:Folate-binding protein n=1 Tax=Homoserinimonas hongtaonis TaxID=2079791 RepID=A0A2U1T2T2_9MICO|nr:glycine cleavage T C-terminal barrel domain-containing protein [Salinibacterium hongtaonis]AWB88409.1 folate-binding protein YgfZ [Salinibacterium hongtaonis]PWB98167.1 folate-binding protein [Salinibacterium hongtaonis]
MSSENPVKDAAVYASPWLARSGAVESDGPDAGVAAHYGDPVREQRQLAAGSAVVDLSHHGVIEIEGADRLSWLDSMSTQSLARLAPAESAEALILDPNGRIEHDMRVLDDGVSLWLLVEGSEAASLAAWLDRMRFMMRVEVRDRTSDFATLGSFADAATLAGMVPIASPHGVPLVWSDPWPDVVAGGWQYAQGEHPGAEFAYREVLVERSALAESDAPAAGVLALEALRVAAWRPRFAREVDERSIPHELDWMRSAVHLNKGCYRGQETVAKVHNLGHPPRRLVMLHLDGSDSILPQPGDEVVLGDRAVGAVTSAVRHHELGSIALAVVKRTLDSTATLTVQTSDGPVAAAQEVIVPASAGATVAAPRLPRLGATTRPSRPGA